MTVYLLYKELLRLAPPPDAEPDVKSEMVFSVSISVGRVTKSGVVTTPNRRVIDASTLRSAQKNVSPLQCLFPHQRKTKVAASLNKYNFFYKKTNMQNKSLCKPPCLRPEKSPKKKAAATHAL